MQIKILQAGWEKFSGEFGGVFFEDGVSVSEVTTVQARRLANQVQIETLDGVNPSSSQAALDEQTIPMDAQMGSGAESAISGPMGSKTWSQAELEALAESKGIAGIREISDPMGIKSNSVTKLIALILDKQHPAKADAVDGLLGSSIQPAQFEIGAKTYTLGDIVRAAFEKSGKSVAEWNEQPDELREQAVELEVQNFKATM